MKELHSGTILQSSSCSQVSCAAAGAQTAPGKTEQLFSPGLKSDILRRNYRLGQSATSGIIAYLVVCTNSIYYINIYNTPSHTQALLYYITTSVSSIFYHKRKKILFVQFLRIFIQNFVNLHKQKSCGATEHAPDRTTRYSFAQKRKPQFIKIPAAISTKPDEIALLDFINPPVRVCLLFYFTVTDFLADQAPYTFTFPTVL